MNVVTSDDFMGRPVMSLSQTKSQIENFGWDRGRFCTVYTTLVVKFYRNDCPIQKIVATMD